MARPRPRTDCVRGSDNDSRKVLEAEGKRSKEDRRGSRGSPGEREAVTLPSASIHERLGFTRREQQIIALLAQGLSNKEIASQFCLSEQKVKNHLYRMKQKSGADGRMGIVRQCRTQGFFV